MARHRYTAEFKREAVKLASKPDVSRREAARQLGIHPNVLAGCAWNEKPESDLKSEQQKELERLRRENASLKMDLDILKKAAAYTRTSSTSQSSTS